MSLRLVALLLVLAASASAAGNYASEWSVASRSKARLIADAAGAGFEIALAPATITYWRDPGEAGVPPSFDFSGSQNLAHADVDFPAPTRIPEPDGSVAFGYSGDVILPIRATPADPAKPIRLVAKVDYAVCEKICLPAKAAVEIALPADGASPFAAELKTARAQTPVETSAAELGMVLTAQGAKSWRLCLKEAPKDLFVEAPEGFWVEPKREADGRCYALELRQAPADAKGAIPLRLTLEGDHGDAQTDVELKAL